MKKLIVCLVVLMPTLVSAGMIEVVDNDPHQFIYFTNCDPAIDSLSIAVQINADSGYWEQPMVLSDTVDSKTFGYIDPDRDDNDNLIPGDYAGEYWIYTISYTNDQPVLSVDTTHVSSAYTILAACAAGIDLDLGQ